MLEEIRSVFRPRCQADARRDVQGFSGWPWLANGMDRWIGFFNGVTCPSHADGIPCDVCEGVFRMLILRCDAVR